MKTLKLFGLFLIGLLIMAGCNTPKPNNGDTIKKMEDLVVSKNFSWKTTKTIAINIKTPVDESNQLIRIYSIDNQNLLYSGYASPGSGIVSAKITVPTNYNMVKLIYGTNNRYKPVTVGIGNDLYYDYNSFKEARADSSNCDLSGFTTFSQGGWHAPAANFFGFGINPGNLCDTHFAEVFPHGLVIGDPNHYEIKLTNSAAIKKFLPGGGHSKVLKASYTNPTSHQKVAGNWGGQIVTAMMNVKFDKKGFLCTNSQKLGNLIFKDGTFEDMSINDFLVIANKAIGGGGLSGYSIKDIANAAELININFDNGKDLGYFTCPPTGSQEYGCKRGLRSLTMKYNGKMAANIKVKERNGNKIIFSGTENSGGTFTFHGSGSDNKMSANIDFYVNNKKDTHIHTTCSVNLYKGDVYGNFAIIDGTSKDGLHLSERPENSCGCEQQMYSLTMRYDGSSTAQITVKEKDHQTVIYNGIVTPGSQISFTGSEHDGKIHRIIYFYEDGVKNATMSTKCSDNEPEVGKKYGVFTVMAGSSKDNTPLCNGNVNPPPGGTTTDYTGTLAYEDLWPYKGDYDFNDLVINYDFSTTKDDNQNVQNITATFIVYAFGASFHNSFGFQFPNVKPNQIISVTGYDLAADNIFTLASNGLESGQSKATAIVYDDSWRLMPYPSKGIGVNTEMDAPFVTPDTIVMHIVFYKNGAFAPGGAVKYSTLDIGNFNPFIVVNQQRGIEVHLPNHAPTDLADKTLLGTGDDNSISATGRFYKTKKNLPWAINIPQVFVWPIEKQDITQAYNYFGEWAESDGTLFPDWYKDKPGYRNADLLYTKHQ